MHHPDPTTFVRRIALRYTPSGKPYAAYRENECNKDSSVWGKPVPYCVTSYTYHAEDDRILVFGDCVAPLSAYLPALEATKDIPIDAPWQGIRFEPGPLERVWAYANDDCHTAVQQDVMKRVRKLAIVDTYRRLQSKYPGLSTDDLLAQVTNLIGKPRSAVRATLISAGIALPLSQSAQLLASKAHKFSKTYEYRHHYDLLTNVIQQCRAGVVQRRRQTGMDEICAFSIADLHDSKCLGGYPVLCPVTGAELDWVESTSYFSPRVGRYDPNKPYVSGNVVLMSFLAKKLIEGRRVHGIDAVLDVRPYLPAAFAAWTAQHPVSPSVTTGLIRARPITEPAPVTPTLEAQREKQQERYRRMDRESQELAETFTTAAPPPPAYDYYTPEDLKRDQGQAVPQPLSLKALLNEEWDKEDEPEQAPAPVQLNPLLKKAFAGIREETDDDIGNTNA